MSESALQTAWSILNDTYRGNLCLLYPPHLLAVAAIYLALIFHAPSRETVFEHADTESSRQGQPRRSSRNSEVSKKSQDPIAFLADLNVSLPLIATIAQEILALYALWDRYKDDNLPDVSARPSPASNRSMPPSHAGTPRLDTTDGVTPTFLSALLIKMRESRLSDLSHPPTARPAAVNKMLERAQAAG